MDGIHLPQPFAASAQRSKGANRAVLATGALMSAMCQPGRYRLGGVLVELPPDRREVVRGSTRLGEVSLETVPAMAKVNPARAARIAGRRQGLVAGEAADLVRFRWDESSDSVAVLETIAAGKPAYQA